MLLLFFHCYSFFQIEICMGSASLVHNKYTIVSIANAKQLFTSSLFPLRLLDVPVRYYVAGQISLIFLMPLYIRAITQQIMSQCKNKGHNSNKASL